MSNRRAIFAALAAQVFFASTSVVGRFALATFTPLAVLLIRVLGAAAVYWAIAPRSAFRLPFTRRQAVIVALCGILGLVINTGLFLVGLSISTAIDATVVNTSIPVFTAGIAIAVGDELPSALKLAGIGLALVGALVLAGVGDLHHLSVGDLLFVANSLCFGGYLVMLRRLARTFDALTLSRWTFLFAALAALPLFAVGPLTYKAPDAWAIAEGAFLVLGPTVLAYGLSAYALERLESSTVASFVYLQPLVTAALAIPLLGERPGPRTGVGALLICAGVVLAGRGATPPKLLDPA
jgi:drug/metabolite transporter (DMT)-like permease